MYICFIRESHESWTYWLIFFIIFCFFCYPTIVFHHTSLLYHLFYHLSLSSRFFLCHEWWSFTFQCMEDGHVLLHSYLMDIGSEILSWEGHLVRESLPTSLFESISISLCILSGAHLLTFGVCASKKIKKQKKTKKVKKKNAFMYVYSAILHWV